MTWPVHNVFIRIMLVSCHSNLHTHIDRPYKHLMPLANDTFYPIARLRTITRTIQAITKDTSLQAYIRLLTAAAPSDGVFRALGTN